MSEKFTAIVINLPNDDGLVRVERVVCLAGDQQSLRWMQGVVGGYIEHLSTPPECPFEVDLWFNEEGKLQSLPINNVATDILWLLYPAFRGYDVLVGNVVLTGHKGPETASVAEGLWEHIRDLPWDGLSELRRIEFVEADNAEQV